MSAGRAGFLVVLGAAAVALVGCGSENGAAAAAPQPYELVTSSWGACAEPPSGESCLAQAVVTYSGKAANNGSLPAVVLVAQSDGSDGRGSMKCSARPQPTSSPSEFAVSCQMKVTSSQYVDRALAPKLA